jgi:hypothetical protein
VTNGNVGAIHADADGVERSVDSSRRDSFAGAAGAGGALSATPERGYIREPRQRRALK